MRPANLILEGFPSATLRLAGADIPQAIPAINLLANGMYPIAALVSTEGAGIRFTFGGVNPSAIIGHILVAGLYIILQNPSQVTSFQFCNLVFGSDAEVHVTLFYEKEVL